MRYLAQVQKQGGLGGADLQLLAFQRAEYAWVVLTEKELISAPEAETLGEGALLLVEVDDNQTIVEVCNATDWILTIIQQYLTNGVTPEFLQQETERAEQWRQSLTLQSQELDRRVLELEARREQIQQLEENLKREKKQFETLAEQK
ncbi:MAG TPA: hypothetical protein V6C46_00955 [Coleofasciculaceae cyanobacterium]